MKRLIDALGKVEQFKQNHDTSGRDVIVYADAVKSNREIMIKTCEMLGRVQRLRLFENGQEVVDYFVEATTKHDQLLGKGKPECKVALLILNINMQKLNGNEAMAQVMELFDQNDQLLRPVTCYLSDTAENVMGQFLTE